MSEEPDLPLCDELSQASSDDRKGVAVDPEFCQTRLHMQTWLDYFPHWRDPVVVHPVAADVLDEGPRDADELAFARFVDSAPKTEVHVHAEAAVPAAFYDELSGKGAEPATPPKPFTDIKDFLRRWMGNLSKLRSAKDYAALGRAFVADRVARRITDCECHVSPLDTSVYRARTGELPVLNLAQNIAAFAAGLRDGMADSRGHVRVRAVVDLVSIATESDLQAAYSALAPFVNAHDNRDLAGKRIIVGIGLGGLEQPARASFFAEALHRFRALGLKLDVHSGEQAHVSAAEHAQTVSLLRPERVGHGFRGAEAGFFFQGALAACPLSNVLLRCHNGPLGTHPISEMLRRELNVSINTDDPLLLGTNLVVEYVALRRAFGFGREIFERTQANARKQLLA